MLGKRKEPPPDPPGDGEEREGEDDQQEQSDATKKRKVVSHDIVHSMTFVFIHVVSMFAPSGTSCLLEITIIGASLSEPHTNQYYEKIAVLMYVCMYVAIRQTRAR